MWKRRRTWLLLVALTGVALAVYFEPSHCVRGWLWREAFFDGRPTSYWRGVVDRDLKDVARDRWADLDPVAVPNWWEVSWGRCKNWIGCRPHADSSMDLLSGGEDAHGVARELTDDGNPNVARFARGVMLARPRLEGCRGSCMYREFLSIHWRRLIVENSPKEPGPHGEAL